TCETHGFLYPEEVQKTEFGGLACARCQGPVTVGRVEKMSKSKKNVIDPNFLLDKYGADVTRLFCLFAAPPEKGLEWSDQGVEGSYRFLNRVWRLFVEWQDAIAAAVSYSGSPEGLPDHLRPVYRKAHQTIRRVTADIEERFHFNTAISAVMELVNEMYAVTDKSPEAAGVMRHAAETTVLLLSPIVPHVCEELWAGMGRSESILLHPWPVFSAEAAAEQEILVVVQVNGKVRDRFTAPADADAKTLEAKALACEQAKKFMGGKPAKKVIVVPGKLVNIVV
ncbi:MAG: class I tRNA ligase family protein, partial [Thermodesulfobacteriota bacterium]